MAYLFMEDVCQRTNYIWLQNLQLFEVDLVVIDHCQSPTMSHGDLLHLQVLPKRTTSAVAVLIVDGHTHDPTKTICTIKAEK